jgi:hypothetical protein
MFPFPMAALASLARQEHARKIGFDIGGLNDA